MYIWGFFICSIYEHISSNYILIYINTNVLIIYFSYARFNFLTITNINFNFITSYFIKINGIIKFQNIFILRLYFIYYFYNSCMLINIWYIIECYSYLLLCFLFAFSINSLLLLLVFAHSWHFFPNK